jgi:serine/threonine protein kinase
MLIGPDFKIKICDLGLAQTINDHHHRINGTEEYMAPELHENGPQGYDPVKADIFALGVSLFVLNFALPPWRKAKMNSAGYIKFTTNLNLFCRSHPGLKKLPEEQIDMELLNFVSTLCAANPADRPDSVEAVL